MKEKANSTFISHELEWLNETIITRLKLYFNQDTNYKTIDEVLLPDITGREGKYPDFIRNNNLTFPDRICLMLSFVPLLKPQLFDCFSIKNTNTGQRFVEFGCATGQGYQGVMPTFEMLLFILAGDSIKHRLYYINYFNEHLLFSQKMLLRNLKEEQDSPYSAVLFPSAALIEELIYERQYIPDFSAQFPARYLKTEQKWEDLVLDEVTVTQINELKLWIKLGDKMLDEWDLRKKIKPGYRALFYGPSGTGKTFTASLLGKYAGKEVYCIDLSMIVSKYIGETEKNLSKVFEIAENKDWILFFDEADSLFGKRTNIKDAHDRYANQEVSYLLQRIEDYDGLVLLSTNLKSNMDEAFTRRFQSVIHFSMPNPEQRELLWRNTFSKKTSFAPDIKLNEIAKKYEISGGSILNVVRYCSLMTMGRNSDIITLDDLMTGIRKEFWKEGKTID